MAGKVVFTINFGDHDNLKEPVKTPGWDYLCFTNNDIKSSGWEIVQTRLDLPNRLAARYVYINSHKFVGDYDFSVLVGGQIKVDGDMDAFVREYYDLSKDINIMRHPCRTCIYKEAEIILRENIDIADNVVPQIQHYANMGFPSNFGLSACGIIGRKNTYKVNEFNRFWWAEVERFSHRDQLSFDYVRWKLDFDSIHWIPYNVIFGKYFSVYIRKTNRRIGGL